MAFIQAPDEVIDYAIDYAGLIPIGDLIISSTWVPDDGISIGRTGISGLKTVAFISGGELNSSYNITNHVTSSQGRVLDQTIQIKVREV